MWYANARSRVVLVLRMCIRFPLLWFICVTVLLDACDAHLHPKTVAMKKELEDSLVSYMQIRNDDEFFRRYIAFNVRFTLRHKWELNDTVIAKELKKELSNMALVQAAQRRVDAIQQKTD